MEFGRRRRRGVGLGLLVWATAWFSTGIGWGLPSTAADPYLFGPRRPWTGQEVMRLAGPWVAADDQGADRPMHPLARGDGPVLLNGTDARRAEIVRRYRLYSEQPDEMITFRSLSHMAPGRLDLDPRLYQYGGLWIYPVGAAIKLLSFPGGPVSVRGDVAYYLDHPAAFARFYLVARGYSAGWGLAGVGVVYGFTRSWAGRVAPAVTAAMAFAALPVVVNAAHEAKPHLAGAVLTVATAWAGLAYVRTGRRQWWVAAGALAGAAVGMVLTGYAAFAVLPTMVALRPGPWRDRMRVAIAATGVGVAIYMATNPYVPIDLLRHRDRLASNLGNSGTFYRPGLSADGLVKAAKWFGEAATWPGVIVGGIAVVGWAVRARAHVAARAIAVLLAPAAVTGVQFVLLAAGKPGEYGRFALLPAVALTVVIAAAIWRLRANDRERVMASALVVVVTAYSGSRYLINFVADRSRTTAAGQLAVLNGHGNRRLAVWAELAPYAVPPVDLFAWDRIDLLPRGAALPPGSVGVRAVDVGPGVPSPISWSNKPIEIVTRP